MDLRVFDVSIDSEHKRDIDFLHDWARVVELIRNYKEIDKEITRRTREILFMQAEKEKLFTKIEISMNGLLSTHKEDACF